LSRDARICEELRVQGREEEELQNTSNRAEQHGIAGYRTLSRFSRYDGSTDRGERSIMLNTVMRARPFMMRRRRRINQTNHYNILQSLQGTGDYIFLVDMAL
jgi:hypothetical protein